MIVRRGITRTVWLTRRYAVKFPSLRPYGNGLTGLLWSICRGILANQAEHTWWTNSHDPALCPVLRSWLGGIVQVYPRCEPLADDYDGPLPEPEHLGDLRDNKPDNFGWLDGRLVRVDYDMNYNGCPHDRSGALRNGLGND